MLTMVVLGGDNNIQYSSFVGIRLPIKCQSKVYHFDLRLQPELVRPSRDVGANHEYNNCYIMNKLFCIFATICLMIAIGIVLLTDE